MRRILVVDDLRVVLMVMGKFLEEAGFEVITAGDGDEALGKALADPPDLIPLDVVWTNLKGAAKVETLPPGCGLRSIDLLPKTRDHIQLLVDEYRSLPRFD